MFTGIVEEIGIVIDINETSSGSLLKVKTEKVSSDVNLGDSIAVNGICLSVVHIEGNIISFDVMPETLKKTDIGELKTKSPVNLERSLKADSRIGGHFVSGHIDYKGRVVDISRGPEGAGYKISLLDEFSKFVVKKGSVSVDGVSLTVADVQRQFFTVYLIPHTLKTTTMGHKKKGDLVNIETDLIGKYIAKDRQGRDLNSILKRYQYM